MQIDLGPTIRERTVDTALEVITNLDVYFLWCSGPTWATASSFLKFLDRTQRHTTVGRTSLDEWSARHRDLYVRTHNIHNRQTSVPPARFEPAISAGIPPQTLIKIDRNKQSVDAYSLTNFGSTVADRPKRKDSHSFRFFFSAAAILYGVPRLTHKTWRLNSYQLYWMKMSLEKDSSKDIFLP